MLAVLLACQQMRERLRDIAALLFGFDPAAVEPAADRLRVNGDPQKSMSLLDVARVANIGKHGITLPSGIQPALETSSYLAPDRAAYASGAHAALVEVDADTGGVQILRYIIGHDCGTVINPMLADGQVLGGFAARAR